MHRGRKTVFPGQGVYKAIDSRENSQMKRILTGILALLLLVPLTACDNICLIIDEEGKPIENVLIQVFRDGVVTPCMTDENGKVIISQIYVADICDVWLSILAAPEGYEYDEKANYAFENGTREMTIVLNKASG